MALLDRVSVMREDYRDLLVEASKQKDPLLEEEALKGAAEKYGEDVIVNATISMVHRSSKPDDEPHIKHLLWSMGFLDDLDTLGMEVRHKQ